MISKGTNYFALEIEDFRLYERTLEVIYNQNIICFSLLDGLEELLLQIIEEFNRPHYLTHKPEPIMLLILPTYYSFQSFP